MLSLIKYINFYFLQLYKFEIKLWGFFIGEPNPQSPFFFNKN